MNPDKLTKTKQQPLKDPLNQDDEDEFFRQLEEEKRAAERKKASMRMILMTFKNSKSHRPIDKNQVHIHLRQNLSNENLS